MPMREIDSQFFFIFWGVSSACAYRTNSVKNEECEQCDCMLRRPLAYLIRLLKAGLSYILDKCIE